MGRTSQRKQCMVQSETLYFDGLARSPARLLSDASPGQALALVYLTDGGNRRRNADSEERARRLLACWNALIGLGTEDIEAMAAEADRKRKALAADEALLAEGAQR